MRRRLLIPWCVVLAVLGLTVTTVTTGATAVPSGGPTPAPPSRGSVVATPPRVTHVHTYVVRDGVSVHWRNPAARTFDHVVLRYARGYTAPTGSMLGRRVRLAGPRAAAGRLERLRPDTVYSLAIWTVGARGNRSAPTKETFTSNALRGPRGVYVGRVVDNQNHPLLNAEVSGTAFTGTDSITARTRTDIHGRFALRLVPGTWRVSLGGQSASDGDSDVAGYVTAGRGIVVRPGATVRAGDVALTPGGAIGGRVIDLAGRPLSGVAIGTVPVQTYIEHDRAADSVYGSAFDGPDAVVTASDGRYTIKGVPPAAAVKVCMSTADRTVTGGSSDTVGYDDRCLPSGTSVGRGGVAHVADLALNSAPGGGASGAVTTRSGEGLAGWTVSFAPTRQTSIGLIAGVAVTRPDGAYELGGLAAGTYRVCAVSGPQPGRTGYLPTCRRSVITILAGSVTQVRLTLAVGAAFTGKVIGPGGVALAGVDVQVFDPGFPNGADAFTDSSGHYTMKGLSAGRRGFCFYADGVSEKDLPTGALSACDRSYPTAVAGAVRTGVDARLGPAGAISGTLRDSAGKPVPFAEVDVIPLDTEGDNDGGLSETDAAGHYVVPGLEASKYSVCFQKRASDFNETSRCHRGHVPVSLGRTTSGTDAVFPVQASISVTVHDAAGHPVAGVDVVVLAPCAKELGCAPDTVFRPHTGVNRAGSATTDGAGVAVLGAMKQGRYAVCLFAYYAATTSGTPADGYADRCTGSRFTVTVQRGKATVVHETLFDGGAVSGTITDGAGHPVSNVLVHVTHSAADDYDHFFFPDDLYVSPFTDAPPFESLTRSDGSYTIRGVQAGSSLVCADASGAAGPNAAGYFDQCLGGAVGSIKGGTAVAVTVDANHTGSDLDLTPAAGIGGTATASDGPRVPNGRALLYAGHTRRLIDDQELDDDGRYAFVQLPAGGYRVCVNPNGFQAQCYQNVAWPSGGPPLDAATVVTAPAGTLTGGIDFHLHS